jgi:hypothetical protein
MADDKSVVGFIRTMAATKLALEMDVLKKVGDTAHSLNREVSAIIDLAFEVTGYKKADIPGGESQIAGNCLTALVKYLTLRAVKESSNDAIEESLLALVTEVTRLYGEVNANRGVRVVGK